MKVPTIGTIRRKTKGNSPHFFEKGTLDFFEQSMSDFTVERSPKGKIFLYAPSTYKGKVVGYTFREYKGSELLMPDDRPVTFAGIQEYIAQH